MESRRRDRQRAARRSLNREAACGGTQEARATHEELRAGPYQSGECARTGRDGRGRRRAVARRPLPAMRLVFPRSPRAGGAAAEGRKSSPVRRGSTAVRRAGGSDAGWHARIVRSPAACGQLRTTARASVLVLLVAMDQPALRSTPAEHAAQEHRAVLTSNAVVVSAHVTSDPAPHDLRLLWDYETSSGRASRMPVQLTGILWESLGNYEAGSSATRF